MAIEICPLASDIGNLADWAAVAVAALGAVAVFMLSRAANRTATASFQLSQRIQQSQDELQLRELRILLSELSEEVGRVLYHVVTINHSSNQAPESWVDGDIAQAVQCLALPVADRERDRLHILPDYVVSGVTDSQFYLRMFLRDFEEFGKNYAVYEDATNYLPDLIQRARSLEKTLSRTSDSITFAIGMNMRHV
ncbi:hypothetical protein [Stenotrophomonas geniculata]|uniref:hypothetical protein n=1 Tax=Stenotrophomonas geniculata TaxID=86188 RepID=UPI003750D1ED